MSSTNNTIWKSHPGGQNSFLSCPINEILLEGDRGGGKTESVLMKYAKYVDRGYGFHWRGAIFRQEFKDLGDVINKSKRIFPKIFGKRAKFLESASALKWVWPDGEELLFRHVKRIKDYDGYHGQEIPFQAWEELTKWMNPDLYLSMMSCARSSKAGVPIFIVATTNPYGPGHSWVKTRFRPRENTILVDESGNKRVSIHLRRIENVTLAESDPNYESRLKAATATDINKQKAWVNGDWDITSGGMIDDLWNNSKHVLQPFPIPHSWEINRSFDWGSSKPFSVGFWAESDGSPAMVNGELRHFPKGSLFRIDEIYGWTGVPNEGVRWTNRQITDEIKEVENTRLARYRIEPGPADSSIFDVIDGNSIGGSMEMSGVYWDRADKSPGSRKVRADFIRQLLYNTVENQKESPGLYIFDNCQQFIRTIPGIPRDDINLDDVDTKCEDHIWDETGYRITSSPYLYQILQTGLEGI